MIRKLILTVGILGALAAAEGLNRFGGLVSAFGGADVPFCMRMLIVSMLSAAVLMLALIGKSSRAVKRTTIVVFAACFVLMLNAPAFPVNIQILFGLAVATGATVWVRPAS